MPKKENAPGNGDNYISTFNAPAINEVFRASKERMTVKDKLTLDGLLHEGIQWVNGVQVILGNYDRLRITDITRKILDILRIKLTKKAPYKSYVTEAEIARVRSITLTLDDFLELCRRSDRKEGMKQLRENAYTLFNISMIWDEEGYILNEKTGRKTRKKIHWDTRLFDSTIEVRNLDSDPVIDSSVTFNFSFDLVRYLCQKYIMGFCKKALEINVHKNPHALCMAHKLMEHYNMNAAKSENGYVRLSVEALLRACPDMPDFSTIAATTRQFSKRIREPFERDLIALRDVYEIIDWEGDSPYRISGGDVVPDERAADFSFDDWRTWLIEFTLPDYPQYEKKPHVKKLRGVTAKREVLIEL